MEGSQFDVFLSFRGEDTRKGFTGHLHEALQLRGVSTFIDNEGLKRGGEIKEMLGYIEKSKICVPIFSKGYADSKWCLRELAKVVECKKKVIPVFFEVDPSDVKKQKGPFASAFEKHELDGQLKPEEVRKWREALTKVGNIFGFTLKDTDGFEEKLVQIIVKRILDEVDPHQFDVYVSFRGADTRKIFTGHLYECLKLHGINTFIDSENLGKGEKIADLLGYIEKSKICIPIFSKGYADSKWCLKELAKVVECNKKVIPVFFDVDPSDVRNQTGPFASAFNKHEPEGQLKHEEVRKWRETLTEVGNISGFTLKDTNGNEAKLVQIIVKKILQELNSL